MSNHENTDCRICLKPNASNYNHYGANFICSSCRAFFMRSIKCDLYKDFKHARKGCIIESIGRRSCKKCRFEKCLQVGMKIAYVSKTNGSVTPAVIHKPRLSVNFTEKSALEQLYDNHFSLSMNITFDVYSQSPKAFLTQVCQVASFNTEDFLKLTEFMDTRILREFATKMTINDDISEDMDLLLKTNHARLQSFYGALIYLVSYSQSCKNWKVC